MKRTKLSDRRLPDYSRGEEIMNMVTHIVGGAIGIVALTLCVIFAALHDNVYGVVSSAIYGSTMITMFTISSVYHGLKPNLGKKVMQVIDHCTIYFLIAGTYTVITLSAIRPVYPGLGWGLFGFEWALVALATTLTAIDLKKYEVFSMICSPNYNLNLKPHKTAPRRTAAMHTGSRRYGTQNASTSSFRRCHRAPHRWCRRCRRPAAVRSRHR